MLPSVWPPVGLALYTLRDTDLEWVPDTWHNDSACYTVLSPNMSHLPIHMHGQTRGQTFRKKEKRKKKTALLATMPIHNEFPTIL